MSKKEVTTRRQFYPKRVPKFKEETSEMLQMGLNFV
jgi:hypothetical protein